MAANPDLRPAPRGRSGVEGTRGGSLGTRQIIEGRYELLEPLGRGGMALVHRGQHLRLGVPVAIKLLVGSSEGLRQRLLAEGRAQASLVHPNIVRVFDVVEHEGQPGLVMELVEGPTLAQLLKAGPLTPPRADALARAMLRGVAAAHARGIVHRDLKPANVLLAFTDEGVSPKVADFGLVKVVEVGSPSTTAGGGTLGTPAYMAPEQVHDPRGVDGRADVFSLGAVLYEMLSGVRCFVGDGVDEVLDRVIRGDHQPLDERVPGLPQRMLDAVEGALVVDRDARISSVPALLARWTGGAELPADADLVDALGARGWARPQPLALGEAPTLSPPSIPSTETYLGTFDLDGPAASDAPATLPDDPLVGRSGLLHRLRQGASPLTTLRGPGGVGKTTLARRWAEERRATWCDCETATTPAAFLARVADALGVADGPTPDAEALQGRVARALEVGGPVVLDNLEQLLPDVAPLIGAWVREAPSMELLLTSRVAVGVTEERVVDVRPLAVEAGVELLRRRSRRALDDSQPLEALVDLLDGLPLAIELAAARLALMSPAQLTERLGHDLALLRERGARGRHASARAVVAWSWELLSPAEQVALAQCSAFVTRFTLEEAEAVIALPPGSPPVWELLEGLADASLLVEEADADMAVGLRLLVVTRSYAEEQLQAMGDAEATWARHLDWCVAEGEVHRGALECAWSPERQRALARLSPELAAAARRGHRRDPVGAARAVLARPELRSVVGSARDHVERLDEVLGWLEGQDAEAVRARAEWIRGMVVRVLGRFDESERLLRAARARAVGCGDRVLAGFVAGQLGNLAFGRGRLDEARGWFTTAIDELRASGRERAAALFLGNLGNAAKVQGQLADAESLYGEALATLGSEGHPANVGVYHTNLGSLLFARGAHDEASSHYRQAAEAFREVGNVGRLGQLQGNRAYVQLALGRVDEARGLIDEALELLRRAGNPVSEGNAWLTEGDVCLAEGDPARADQAYLQALTRFRGAASPRFEGIAHSLLGRLAMVRGRPEAEGELVEARRLLGTADDAAYHAFTTAHLVALRKARGDVVDAAELHREGDLGASSALYRVVEALLGQEVDLAEVRGAAATDHHWRWALELVDSGGPAVG